MSIQSISSQEKSEAVSQTEAARNVERFPLPPPFFLPRITSRRGFPPLQNAATAELLMAFHILKPVSTYPYFEWKCNYTRARRAAHPPFLLIRFFLSLSSPFFRGQPNTSGENFFFSLANASLSSRNRLELAASKSYFVVKRVAEVGPSRMRVCATRNGEGESVETRLETSKEIVGFYCKIEGRFVSFFKSKQREYIYFFKLN